MPPVNAFAPVEDDLETSAGFIPCCAPDDDVVRGDRLLHPRDIPAWTPTAGRSRQYELPEQATTGDPKITEPPESVYRVALHQNVRAPSFGAFLPTRSVVYARADSAVVARNPRIGVGIICYPLNSIVKFIRPQF